MGKGEFVRLNGEIESNQQLAEGESELLPVVKGAERKGASSLTGRHQID